MLDFAVPLRRVALTRKTRIAMLHKSSLRVQDKADTASPFLKGEGGVMRVLEISARIAYMSGMLRGRVMSYPKKIMHTWDKCRLRYTSENRLLMKNK